MLLPWLVFSVLSDGRRVLVARVATRSMAEDFKELQMAVSGEQYDIERE